MKVVIAGFLLSYCLCITEELIASRWTKFKYSTRGKKFYSCASNIYPLLTIYSGSTTGLLAVRAFLNQVDRDVKQIRELAFQRSSASSNTLLEQINEEKNFLVDDMIQGFLALNILKKRTGGKTLIEILRIGAPKFRVMVREGEAWKFQKRKLKNFESFDLEPLLTSKKFTQVSSIEQIVFEVDRDIAVVLACDNFWSSIAQHRILEILSQDQTIEEQADQMVFEACVGLLKKTKIFKLSDYQLMEMCESSTESFHTNISVTVLMVKVLTNENQEGKRSAAKGSLRRRYRNYFSPQSPDSVNRADMNWETGAQRRKSSTSSSTVHSDVWHRKYSDAWPRSEKTSDESKNELSFSSSSSSLFELLNNITLDNIQLPQSPPNDPYIKLANPGLTQSFAVKEPLIFYRNPTALKSQLQTSNVWNRSNKHVRLGIKK